jgi:hypothetical protein
MSTCGTCKHWELIEGNLQGQGTCYGVPPTPILIVTRNALGQMEQAVKGCRAPMLRTDRACGLYATKLEMP